MYNPFQLKPVDDYLIINEADEPEIEEDVEDNDELDDTENLHSALEDEEYDDSEPDDKPSVDEEESELEDVGEPPIDDEEESEEESEEPGPAPTEGPDDYDLKDFGNHGGPDVPNNQYNEKDVEILNKLISSESDAINDYFDATTNTVDTNLSRLYGDIGREERFHLEQLMYAKSLITGEKYEPKDPEVKKEYEELIGQGMDEDTAIVTTIDKISVSGGPMSDEEFEDAKEEVAQQESVVFQTQAILDMIEDTTYAKLFNEYCNRLENYADFYQEEVLNVNTQPKSVTEGTNPISWILKQLGNIVKFAMKLGTLVREHLRRSRVKRNKILEWVKYNKISGIFAKGYSFYTYDLKKGFSTDDIVYFAKIAYKTTELIGQACGKQSTYQARLDTSQVPVHNIEQGLRLINGMQFMKTKVVVNDSNEDYIKSILFGATKDKMVKSEPNVTDNGKYINVNTKVSVNYYNIISQALIDVQQAAVWSDDLAKVLKDMEGKPGLYQQNHSVWLRSINQLMVVTKGFTKIISALNHDINTMLSIDKIILEMTNHYDQTREKNGVTFVGDGMNSNTQPDIDRTVPIIPNRW